LRTPQRPLAQAGFTLIELVVVMALVAVVVPTLAIGMISYFKSSFSAAARADQAHYSKLWAASIQRDLASAETASTSSGGCSSPAVLSLSWSQPNPLPNGQPGSDDDYEAVYGVVADAGSDGPYVLNRALTANSVTTIEPMVRNIADPCDVVFQVVGGEVRAAVEQRSAAADGPSDTTYAYGRVGVRQ
jgi:prepilin-type N-terminal cleavage/methylation domain-containing protein